MKETPKLLRRILLILQLSMPLIYIGLTSFLHFLPIWDEEYPANGRSRFIDYVITQEEGVTYVWHKEEIVAYWSSDDEVGDLVRANNYVARKRIVNPPDFIDQWATPAMLVDTLRVTYYDTIHVYRFHFMDSLDLEWNDRGSDLEVIDVEDPNKFAL